MRLGSDTHERVSCQILLAMLRFLKGKNILFNLRSIGPSFLQRRDGLNCIVSMASLDSNCQIIDASTRLKVYPKTFSFGSKDIGGTVHLEQPRAALFFSFHSQGSSTFPFGP